MRALVGGALGVLVCICACSDNGSAPGDSGVVAPGDDAQVNPGDDAKAVPDDNYIDTHMHLNVGKGPMKNPSGAAQALLALMDANGVEKSVIVVVPSHTQSPSADLQEAADGVAAGNGRLFLAAGGATLSSFLQEVEPATVTDETKANFSTQAEALITEKGAIAFGEMISFHLCMSSTHSYQVALANHPLYKVLSDIAAKHGVPIDLHMEATETVQDTPENLKTACAENPDELPASVPPLEELLAHNRKTKIVWQHVGWDNLGNMTPTLVKRLLGDHANLYVSMRVEDRPKQIESSEDMPNRIVGKDGKITTAWLDVINQYSDRVLIGSDEFVAPAGNDVKFPTSFVSTWSILSQLSAEVAKKVGHDNAASVYNLK